MLEETRDTITVPAAFMIRMLACLNQIRRGVRFRHRRREDEDCWIKWIKIVDQKLGNVTNYIMSFPVLIYELLINVLN